jgi:hypothetical protein
MTAEYKDPRIECFPDGVRIRGYYFPLGSKRIPYQSIRSIRRGRVGRSGVTSCG